jgi:ABC-type lipoprotein release transport system permease subunit
MRYLLEIARTGLTSVMLHPLRSVVTTACVVVLLLPFLVGLALSEGVEQEARDSVRFGADLYVSGDQFGRRVPIPLEAVNQIAKIEGVQEVIPRIVGSINLGAESENAVMVGMPVEKFPSAVTCVEGRLPRPGNRNELVVGTELARRLKLHVGDLLPPFYHNSKGDRISEVVGLFDSDVSLWQARLVLTSFDTAAEVFDQPDLATDLLVQCRAGYQESVTSTLQREIALSPNSSSPVVRARVTSREELQAIIPAGLLHRGGIFNLHFVLAFAVGIPVVLVTSGLGLSERRREVGILKATGWQTDEVLLRGAVESLVLSLAAACIAILLAFVWLQWFNGYWIASLFLNGIDAAPALRVPFRLAPIPALLAFLLSFVLVMTGTLYSSWRAAIVAPIEAMR